MLSQLISKQSTRIYNPAPIEMPKSPSYKPPIQIIESINNPSLELLASHNFAPTNISCTPPEGYFIHKLNARMNNLNSKV
jgi:hypothetical protein